MKLFSVKWWIKFLIYLAFAAFIVVFYKPLFEGLKEYAKHSLKNPVIFIRDNIWNAVTWSVIALLITYLFSQIQEWLRKIDSSPLSKLECAIENLLVSRASSTVSYEEAREIFKAVLRKFAQTGVRRNNRYLLERGRLLLFPYLVMESTGINTPEISSLLGELYFNTSDEFLQRYILSILIECTNIRDSNHPDLQKVVGQKLEDIHRRVVMENKIRSGQVRVSTAGQVVLTFLRTYRVNSKGALVESHLARAERSEAEIQILKQQISALQVEIDGLKKTKKPLSDFLWILRGNVDKRLG